MKVAGRAAAPASTTAQVAGFIAKFDPPIQRLIRSARARLRKRLPTAVELVYDNYNFFVIGYGPTERASDAIFSLAAYAKGAGLAFLRGATLSDPHGILEGEGKHNRFLRLRAASDLGRPEVETLIRAAIAQAKTPLPKTGRVRTVVKSVSAKQRPRRAPAAKPARRAPAARKSQRRA